MQDKFRETTSDNLKYKLLEYCGKFQDIKNEIILSLKDLHIDLSDSIPDYLFCSKNNFTCYYSTKTKEILILIDKADKFNFKFEILNREIFTFHCPELFLFAKPIFQIVDTPYSNVDGSFIYNDLGVEIPGYTISGGYLKFTNYYRNTLCQIELHGMRENENVFLIKYGILYSQLDPLSEDINSFIKEIFNGFIDNKKLKEEGSENILNRLCAEFESLLYNDYIIEKDLDDFFDRNPILLETIFNLTDIINKPLLEDLNNTFGQNLIPDLIGYDLLRNEYVIVDYKKANNTILRAKKNVRLRFTADVSELISQLEDYREFFNDSNCRDYFFNKYGRRISNPRCLGIIGEISEVQRISFNKVKRRNPQVEIIPYFDVLNSLKEFIRKFELKRNQVFKK